LHNLSDFRPKEPSDAEVKIIKELFEQSVNGEAYDLEKYGQYYRPAGVSAPQKSSTTDQSSNTESAPAESPKEETKVETTKVAQPAPTSAPAGDSAKRAEDILKLIRSRQAK